MARTKQTARKSTGGKSNCRRNLAPAVPAHHTRSYTARRAAYEADRDTRYAVLRAQALSSPKRKPRRRLDPWTPKRKKNPNSTPRPRAPPATHYTCRICVEEQPIDQFARWIPPRLRRWNNQQIVDVPFNCMDHLARNPRKKHIDPVCKECIGNSMSARLDTVGARNVGTGCLEPGCGQVWSHDLIMQYLPHGEPLEKYNMEMFDVWLADTTPKPLTCPSPGCTAVGMPDPTAAGFPQVTCHECSFRSCAQCHVAWHADVTCAEYSAKKIDEQMSDPEKETLKFMQAKDGKRCPNCYLVIEKDGGCDSMYCTGCHKYFNWATAASAVIGTNKAQPFVKDLPYWQVPTSATCEMDGILAADGGIGSARPAPVVAAAA